MYASELAARLDRLPLSRFHRRVLFGIAFAFFFELADLNTFAYAATGLEKYLGMSVATIADITSASFAGMFIGAAVGGGVADRLGRRRALIWAVLWFSLFSLLNAAAWNAASIAVARFLTGIGLSAMTVIAITYLSETMPKSHRGRMQGAALAIGLAGIPVMAFFARGVVPTGPNGWRWVFVFGALGAVAAIFIARLPESPRWLLEHGDPGAAETTLAGIEAEVAEDTATGQLPPPETRPAEVTRHHDPRDLFRGKLARRTLMLLAVWIFQTLGFYGFTSFVPVLLAAHGFGLTKSLTFSALITIGAVPGGAVRVAYLRPVPPQGTPRRGQRAHRRVRARLRHLVQRGGHRGFRFRRLVLPADVRGAALRVHAGAVPDRAAQHGQRPLLRGRPTRQHRRAAHRGRHLRWRGLFLGVRLHRRLLDRRRAHGRAVRPGDRGCRAGGPGGGRDHRRCGQRLGQSGR